MAVADPLTKFFMMWLSPAVFLIDPLNWIAFVVPNLIIYTTGGILWFYAMIGAIFITTALVIGSFFSLIALFFGSIIFVIVAFSLTVVTLLFVTVFL